MFKIKYICVLFIALFCLILSSCNLSSCSCNSCKNDKLPNDPDNGQNDPPSEETKVIEKNIGTAGGQIQDEENGLSLSIPANALVNNTDISIQLVNNISDMATDPSMGFWVELSFIHLELHLTNQLR